MKNLLSLFLIFCGLFLFNQAKATHILGGEIYYDSLGNGNYKITFDLDLTKNNLIKYGIGFDVHRLIKEKKLQQITYMIKKHMYNCEFINKTRLKYIKIT